MSRGGRAKLRDDPQRKCLVTGDSGPKTGLVRFVVGPDGTVVPDVLGKLPGRGLWVTSDRAVLEKAVAKRLFSRAARQQVTAPDGLIELVELQLANRVTDLIALARKAGEAVAGYEKVKAWLLNDQAAVLLQAHDGSERGRSKLRPPRGPETLIEILSADEIGAAFGREKVIHGALAGGGLTHRVVEDAARLAGLRPQYRGEGALGKE